MKYVQFYNSFGLPFGSLDHSGDGVELWSYSDASFGNLTGGGTQASVMLFVVETQNVLESDEWSNKRGKTTGVYDRSTGEEEVESVQDLEKTVKKSRPKFSFEAVAKREKRWFRAHMAHWRPFRLRRVTRSTFGSETLAMAAVMDAELSEVSL